MSGTRELKSVVQVQARGDVGPVRAFATFALWGFMHRPTQPYVRRGDQERRKDRIKQLLIVGAAVVAVALLRHAPLEDAHAKEVTFSNPFAAVESRRLQEQVDGLKGELGVASAQLQRANLIIGYSTRYKVAADLAASVYDVALAEGIEPELGFRLVNVESQFTPRAVSHAGAIGLTQVMPATASYFERGITRQQLFDPKTNLTIGFRYLRSLIIENKGDVKLALLVYNRGPAVVSTLRALGLDPRNGYESAVTRGYKGKGTVD